MGNNGSKPTKTLKLFEASASGDVARMRELLARPDVDPAARDGDGATPLHYAAMGGSADAVRVLLGDRRVDPDAAGPGGATPLLVACSLGAADAARALLADRRVDADAADADGRTALFVAAQEGHGDVAGALLLDGRADANKADDGGYTPFVAACATGRSEVVALLLADRRVNVNVHTAAGDTGFIAACLNGDAANVLLLLLGSSRVDVNAVDLEGNTGLMVASRNGHDVAVKLLLSRTDRVDVRRRNKAGRTAAEVATSPEVRKLFDAFGSGRPVSPTPPRPVHARAGETVGKLRQLDSSGNPRGPEFTVDCVVHLGRSEGVEDHGARALSGNIRDAQLAIMVSDNIRISRNHALLYPPENAKGRHGFSIVDLNSSNGTLVDGTKAQPGKHVPLKDGSVITLGGNEKFRLSVAVQPGRGRALLVGHSGGNLQGPEHDLDVMRSALQKRGFTTTKLFGREAKPKAIRAAIAQEGGQLGKDDLFVLHYSGHGTEDGSLVVEGGLLKPSAMLPALGDLRCRKLVILDGCFTFAVASDLPPRTALIGNVGPGLDMNLGGRRSQGMCTVAVVDALAEDPHRVRFDELVDRLGRDPRLHVLCQNVDAKYRPGGGAQTVGVVLQSAMLHA